MLWIQCYRLGAQRAVTFHLLFPRKPLLVDVSADTVDGGCAGAGAWHVWAAHVYGSQGMYNSVRCV